MSLFSIDFTEIENIWKIQTYPEYNTHYIILQRCVGYFCEIAECLLP